MPLASIVAGVLLCNACSTNDKPASASDASAGGLGNDAASTGGGDTAGGATGTGGMKASGGTAASGGMHATGGTGDHDSGADASSSGTGSSDHDGGADASSGGTGTGGAHNGSGGASNAGGTAGTSGSGLACTCAGFGGGAGAGGMCTCSSSNPPSAAPVSCDPVEINPSGQHDAPANVFLAGSASTSPYHSACNFKGYPANVITLFHLSTPMQLTVWTAHPMTSSQASFGVSRACDSSAVCLASQGPAIDSNILSLSLGSGLYELDEYASDATLALAQVVFEPPLPAPKNTTCATAAPLSGTYQEQRVIDGGPRYYSFTKDSAGLGGIPTSIHFITGMDTGTVNGTVQCPCGGAEVGFQVIGWGAVTGDFPIDMSALPDGPCVVELHEIPKGLQYEIGLK